MGYFSHILDITAIASRHWIQFLNVTYTMECLKDKIIMCKAYEVAYGAICGLKRSKICDFLIIFQALEPRYDPISDARRHMNDYFNFMAVIVY